LASDLSPVKAIYESALDRPVDPKWCIRQVYALNSGVKIPRFRKVFAVREGDAAERADVEKLAHSRKAEARLVERAAIVWRCLQGQPTGATAAELKLDRRTVHHWLAPL
jgi:hypothetical protein